MTKRIFVSVDLSLAVKDALQRLQNRGVYWIKWMSPKNMHITLNFLGDLNDKEITETAGVLSEVVRFFEPFTLVLEKARAERDMLWIVLAPSEKLFVLQREIKGRLKHKRLGKSERRNFSPHILLGKSKTGRYMSYLPKHFQPREFVVDSVKLYSSELTPGEATHKLIESFPLTKSANS